MGDKLKSIRKNKGLTQVQLAAKIGCTQKDISRWENGERVPNIQSLKSIAEALGCKLDDLV